MKKQIAYITCVYFFALASFASVIVNETLFEINQEVWTSYDLKQFVKAKSKTPLNLAFFNDSDDDFELFLATRLLYYQMVDSMDSADLVKLKARQLLATDPVDSEILKIKLLNDTTDFKFKTASTDQKYDMWINYMKKKYNFISQK